MRIDDYDAGRGGWGQLKTREEIDTQRQGEQDEIYRGDHEAGGAGREVPSGGGTMASESKVGEEEVR